jgi:hypothetical protein
VGRLGELCEHNPGHAGVDENAYDALNAHNHDSHRALGRCGSAAVSVNGNSSIS